MSEELKECAWCGAEIFGKPLPNRTGEVFCSKSHRQESNAALRQFRKACERESHPYRALEESQ